MQDQSKNKLKGKLLSFNNIFIVPDHIVKVNDNDL